MDWIFHRFKLVQAKDKCCTSLLAFACQGDFDYFEHGKLDLARFRGVGTNNGLLKKRLSPEETN